MSGAALLMAMGPRGAGVITVGTDTAIHGYFESLFGSSSPAAPKIGIYGVRAITWNIAGDVVALRIIGAGQANSNATFTSLIIGGHVLARGSASYTADDGSDNTVWTWGAETGAFPSSGTFPWQAA